MRCARKLAKAVGFQFTELAVRREAGRGAREARGTRKKSGGDQIRIESQRSDRQIRRRRWVDPV